MERSFCKIVPKFCKLGDLIFFYFEEILNMGSRAKRMLFFYLMYQWFNDFSVDYLSVRDFMIEKLVLSSGIVIKWQKNDSICPKNKKILSATPIWKSSARPWLRIWKRKLIKTLYPLKYSFFFGGGRKGHDWERDHHS